MDRRSIMSKNGFNTAVLITPGGANWLRLLHRTMPVAETRRLTTVGRIAIRLLARALWSIIRNRNMSRRPDAFCGFSLRVIRPNAPVAAQPKSRLRPSAGCIESGSNSNR